MKILMLSLGIGGSTDRAGGSDDGSARHHAVFQAAFQLGPAWHGGQGAIFLKTDKSVGDAYQHVLRVLDDRDLLLVIELPESADVRFSGLRFDEEGFDEIFPAATEIQHLNEWRG